MNFHNNNIDDKIKEQLNALTSLNKLPHAIIICGGNEKIRDELISVLCHYAVCSSNNKPCYTCKNCTKATVKSHPDIQFIEGSKKTKAEIYSKDIVEEVIRDTAIIPNEADTKVYVFRDVDEKFPVISQNAFLKTLEEPPQSILFVMTCKDASVLLETILSRCTLISVPKQDDFSAEYMALAEDFAMSFSDINEYSLLKEAGKLNKKETALSVLPILKSLMRDCLVLSVGGTGITNSEVPEKILKKLTREKILKILNIIDDAQQKINSNVNMTLLSTWLCTEIRRTLWQK